MILPRYVLVPKGRVREEVRKLMGTHWPGGEAPDGRPVPENKHIRCRAIRGQEQEGWVLLECTYEG